MKETDSNKSPLTDRIRSWAKLEAYGGSRRSDAPANSSDLPLSNTQSAPAYPSHRANNNNNNSSSNEKDGGHGGSFGGNTLLSDNASTPPDKVPSDSEHAGNATAPASEAEGSGTVVDENSEKKKKKKNVVVRFFLDLKTVLLHSWINVLLVFAPVGIVVANIPGMNDGVIFGINAIAIIPLAGILSHATETVARKMGDTLGALLNVSFGNAVELIIFIIALVKGEIRIVQASLLGSILANLLLILGMAFFLGGLRFREQIYNSTVTQMSACLLSLSVISLVLPTAFHASFKNKEEADANSLIISRGTSVILLLVYGVYLLFQLRSHAYMYESTPQHIVDAESTPGPAAGWLDTSSSESSSSSDSDSDGSGQSKNTMSKRVKRAIRRHRRKSSTASTDTSDGQPRTRTSSVMTNTALSPVEDGAKAGESSTGRRPFPRLDSYGSDEVVIEEEPKRKRKHRKSKKSKRGRKTSTPIQTEPTLSGENIVGMVPGTVVEVSMDSNAPRRVDFAESALGGEANAEPNHDGGGRRPLNNIRGISFRPVAKSLTPSVFAQTASTDPPPARPAGPVPRVRYGIRRTNSLPDRLGQQYQFRPPGAMLPAQIPQRAITGAADAQAADDDDEDHLSQKAAIVMLLLSTALVAVCAEFMVDAIQGVVENSSVKEIFIGLIILPIVGNAAEHVTAVMVALRNKMDLAIGVAVGSSIQIALFLTPIVVILGWIIGQPMTLYFTLFETVCLFVSAFIVNFLVLDGRSNYLEGALLVATYVIIALVAFYYPEGDSASEWGA